MRNNIPSTLGIGVTTTWNGSAWSNGTPTVNKIARIAGTYTTATHGSISCLDLYLDSGTITISPDTYIRVNRNITQAASGVTFDMSGYGALALYNPNVDASSVKLTITKTLPLNYARLEYAILGNAINGRKQQLLSPGTLPTRIYRYNTTNGSFATSYLYDAVTPGADVANTIFKGGVGFLIRVSNTHPTTPAPWTITTTNVDGTGSLNTGVITVPFEIASGSTTFPFVANPYTAPIDLGKFLEVNPFMDGYVSRWVQSFNAPSGTPYVSSNKYLDTQAVTATPSIGIFEGFSTSCTSSITQRSIKFTPDMMVLGNNYDLVNGFTLSTKVAGVDQPVYRVGYCETNYPVNFINTEAPTTTTGNPTNIKIEGTTSRYKMYGDTTQRSELFLDAVGASSASTTMSLSNTTGRFADPGTEITMHDLTLNISQSLKIGDYAYVSTLGESYADRFKIVIS